MDSLSTTPNCLELANSRRSKRKVSPKPFPIHQEVYYTSESKRRFCVGNGKTIEISSREVLFTTPDVFKPRQRIRLNIKWPVLLGDACLLKLQILGSVLESEPGRTRVAIQRHQFRTGAIVPGEVPLLAPLCPAEEAE